MKVAIVTAYSADYRELAAVTNISKQRYADRHGYTFVVCEVEQARGDACKHDLYMELIGNGFDVFVWIDTDAIITNASIRIEDICRTHMGYDPEANMDSGCHFLWGYDYAGPNSGVYIARFSPQGAHWMDRAYATMRENGLADETAMEMLKLSEPFNAWVRVVPGSVLNCYDYDFYGWNRWGEAYGKTVNAYQLGRFILHMPGHSNEKRIPELQRRYLEAKNAGYV